MKGIFKVAIFTFLFLSSCLFTQKVIFAHPGGTDADGGHYCHTDCEDWELEYEEYHYHDSVEIDNEYDTEDITKDKSDIALSPIEIIITLGVCVGFWILVWWMINSISKD